MTKDEIKTCILQKLSGRSKLATLIGVVRKVERLVGDIDTSAHELASLIRSDAVLTSRMLEVVNSVGMSAERRISSVDEAVVRLGFERVRTICAGLMGGNTVKAKGMADFQVSDLWCHAVATSVGAEHIYARFGADNRKDMICTAGLLCNIGRMMLFEWFRDECTRITDHAVSENISLLEAERRELGVTHADIGYWAAVHWGFDDIISHVILYHHGPETSQAIDIINLAYVCAQAMLAGSPGENRITPLLPGLFERMEIGEGELQGLLDELGDLYKGLTPVFEMMRQS